MLEAFHEAIFEQLGIRTTITLDWNESQYGHDPYATFLEFTNIFHEQDAEQRCLKNREAKDEQSAGKVSRKTRLSKKPY